MKIIYLLLLFGFDIIAQNADSTGFSNYFNITFGGKFLSKLPLVQNNQINYFDYLYVKENQQLGFQFRKELSKRNALTFTVSTYSDLVPRNIEILYSKLIKKNLGYFIDLKKYTYYFIGYPLVKSEGEFSKFNNTSNNLRYDEINQPSIHIGPLLYFKRKRFTIESKLNLGFGYLGKFNETGILKSDSTFEVVQIDLKNTWSPYISIIPDFNLSFFPFQLKKSKIGITAYGNFQRVKRSFDYQLLIHHWTIEDIEKQNFKGIKQQFNNFEVNLGLVWQSI